MNLTLVIPTFNRPDCLHGLLQMLEQFGFSGQVVVADSGSGDTRIRNKQRSAEWSAVTYVEFPSETAPFRKFTEGIALASTDYVALLADDDLAFPSGLTECVSFLNDHPSYAAAHGIYLSFGCRSEKVLVAGLEYDSPSIEADSAFDRLYSLMENYQALTYCVQRRECAMQAFEHASKLNGILWQELAGGSVTAMQGPIKRLPAVTHARQRASTLGYHNWHPVEWLVRDASGLFLGFADYTQAMLRFAETAPGTMGLARADILDAINKAGLRYLAPYLENAETVALSPYPASMSQAQKSAAAIDRWNNLRTGFPRSFLLKQNRLRSLARTLKSHLPSTYSGGYKACDSSGNNGDWEIEFDRNVVAATKDTGGNAILDKLGEQFAFYLSEQSR